MTDQPLTNDEIEAIKRRYPTEAYYEEDRETVHDDIYRLITELERVKLEANARAYDAELHHAQELMDLKVQHSRRQFDVELQHAYVVADKDAEIERLKRASVPPLRQDLP